VITKGGDRFEQLLPDDTATTTNTSTYYIDRKHRKKPKPQSAKSHKSGCVCGRVGEREGKTEAK